jgi:carbamoyltransferase
VIRVDCAREFGRRAIPRTGPRHPRLSAFGYRIAQRPLERYFQKRHIYRADSEFAGQRLAAIGAKLGRGETVYLAGISAAGLHNSGVALVEVTQKDGVRLICNNEEERFSGVKHTDRFPEHSIAALLPILDAKGLKPADIDAWLSAWDQPALYATFVRTVLEEAPASFSLLANKMPQISLRRLDSGVRAAKRLGRALGLRSPVPIIETAHHDNHAWFSFVTSPFSDSDEPVMVLVLDGLGDQGSISLYVCRRGEMTRVSCNDSVFDSLGIYYSVLSSTQGGWTWLSSEGRYMGAAAYGDGNRATNRYYAGLKSILELRPDGQVLLNRDLANWPRDVRRPYSRELKNILGAPIPMSEMWNPDAVLRIEDTLHREDTQDRLDKAAATQMVFEDALIHIADHFIRATGSRRLIVTGGIGLNAAGNMQLLERFGGLHLWVPPTPNDSGVAIGAAYMGAYLCGARTARKIDHAFYCGTAPRDIDIRAALEAASDIAWLAMGRAEPEAVADFMAYMTAQDGIFALYQGAAETGPRALGHRSILANPCNPKTRENLNARVKYREAIRPLAPMLTLDAARRFFELAEGASDDSYNAYNYMVLTARARPEARAAIPAVIHANGTGRLQIVRAHTDPLTHSYLRSLGRRIGVEVAVNTSFNVAGPIAQTPQQAIATLLRAKGLDAVIMRSGDGTFHAVWQAGAAQQSRLLYWLDAWQAETGQRLTP